MLRSTRRRVALGAAALLAGSCGYDITTREMVTSGTVATYRAPGASFASYATFAMVSRVGLVTDASPAPAFATAPALLGRVASLLEARGYLRAADVDPTSPPAAPVAADLAVNVTALEAAQGAPAYWSGHPGHWQPEVFGRAGDTWVYPWSWVPIPPRTGTVLVELADLRAASGGEVEVVWAALGYGVSAGADAYDSVSVLDAVDRAFAQSPYLGTGGAP